MRAFAIKVDEVANVSGFVTPGQRVDVLSSGNAPGAARDIEGTQVKTLIQNIEVLSAGTDFQKDGEGKPQQVTVVNLLVSPEQAEVLSLGQQPDAYSTGPAQPTRHADRADLRYRDGQPLRRRPAACCADCTAFGIRSDRSNAAQQA